MIDFIFDNISYQPCFGKNSHGSTNYNYKTMAREYSEEGFFKKLRITRSFPNTSHHEVLMVIHTLRIGIKTATKLLPKSERL